MSGQIGRPREFDEGEVLTDIMSAFWKTGYEGTGLAQITKVTGLQKGSLYKAFTDKHDMYVKALAHYEKNVVDGTVKSLISGKATPYKRIKAFLSAPINAAWNKDDWSGCFLCNASADYAAHDDDTRALVARGYSKLERALITPIAEIHPEWSKRKVEQNAQLCLTIYTGLRIMARAAVERKQLEGARDACLAMLNTPQSSD